MYVTPEQIQTANKANVEALLAVANAQFSASKSWPTSARAPSRARSKTRLRNTRALWARRTCRSS